MQLWPTPTRKLFQLESLLVISLLSNLSGSFLIFSTILNTTRAILAAAAYTYLVRLARNIKVPHTSLYSSLFLSYFSGLVYFNTTSWSLLVYLFINLIFSFICFYIPLLYDLYDGIIGYGDMCGTFLYMALKAISLKMVWISNKQLIEKVSSKLLGFVGLVLILDAFLFLKQFRFLKMQRIRRRGRI